MKSTVALAEDHFQLSASTWWLPAVFDSSSKGYDDLFYSLLVPGAHVVHIHISRQNIYIK